MKKQYFLMAMAATMFAACSQTEVIDEVVDNSTPKAIGFTTYAEGQTRAENSTGNYTWPLENHHKTFKVWGYKNVSETKVFDNQLVEYSTSWGYTPLRYWDKAATDYEFYAAAPAKDKEDNYLGWALNQNTSAHNDDFFTLVNFGLKGVNLSTKSDDTRKDSWLETSDIDLMIADEKNVPNANFTTNPVEFQFNHILSRLNVTLYKDAVLELETVTLKSIVVKGLNATGNFNESLMSGVDLKNGTHERWTNQATPRDIKLEGNYTIKEKPAGDTKFYVIQSLVIPQEFEYENINLDGTTDEKKPYFVITYTIGNEEFVAYYNLAQAFGATSGKLYFNEGWENILNITIKPTGIVLDATVAEWVFKSNKDLTIE
ncbi:MAG: fimbrillin family protein [Prevotella sp.]|nr:fimbrillin family protein [Prevotella sp.]